MRLFTGIAIDEALVNRLSSEVEALRGKARLNWSRPENYHVTTKFLGECADHRLAAIVAALEQVPRPAKFEITIEGLGFFPNARSPRVFWAGVRASGELMQMASDTDAALSPIGFAAEARQYSPHLTLARMKAGQSAAAILDCVAHMENTCFGRFTAAHFYLYRSRTGPRGSTYEKLREFLF